MNDCCDYVYKRLEVLYKNMDTISSEQLEANFSDFIQTKYLWIDKSNFKRLLNKAWYFAMHDGLDTAIKWIEQGCTQRGFVQLGQDQQFFSSGSLPIIGYGFDR